MRLGCVVLDFDGTFTDVAREAAPFVVAFRADVDNLVGRPEAEAAWSDAERELKAHPMHHGWRVGGRVVAPAAADPYVRATCTAQLVLDRFGLLQNHDERSAVLQTLYHEAYRRSATAFRPDAAETLAQLLDAGLPIFVVTNARTEIVKRKLATLADLGAARAERASTIEIIGDAQKYLVAEPARADARFAGLPAERWLPGLDTRPICLRRGKYFEVLSRIWTKTGTGPEDTLVVGDIFELDLAMPAELGARVHLLATPETPAYERAAIEAIAPRGAWSERLSAVVSRLAA